MTETDKEKIARAHELCLAAGDTQSAEVIRDLALEVADYENLISMQHKRTRAADLAWREAHPGNDNVLPDLGDLIGWLMEKAGLNH